MTTLVGRHFQSGMLPFERASKKTLLGHIFVKNWRPNEKCTFLAGLSFPLRGRSMIRVPQKAHNLSQSMFFCMLFPYSMFLLDSDEGKVKYLPL